MVEHHSPRTPPDEGAKPVADWLIPTVAVLVSTGYLVAVLFFPAVLVPVTVTACSACCGLVLCRRKSRSLRVALGLIALWLGIGLSMTWWGASTGQAGSIALILGLYALPLPILPWMYWRSFKGPRP